MQDGDGQEPAGDVCGAELEPGTSDSGDDMIGVSDSGKSASLSTAGEWSVQRMQAWRNEVPLHRSGEARQAVV
jgi:hypothetical protein